MFENFSWSSWDLREARSLESLLAGLGVPGVACGWGGLSRASERKVDATSNCPSRRRCMAIALLIREGCEARASYSVGRALTGKYCSTSAEIVRYLRYVRTLSRDFPKLLCPL